MSWERPDPDPAGFLAWSVPLVRFAGIRFRVHFTFLAYAALVLLMAAFGPPGGTPLLGIASNVTAIAALLVVVLVREAARALVVRAAGGSADEVILWPLGSLRGIDPAPGARAALLAAAPGAAASLVLLAAVGIPLGLATGEWAAVAVPDPLDASWLSNPHPAWMEALWITQWTGVQVFLIALLPLVPLDGGRVVTAIAMRSRGEFDAPRVTATFSLVASGVLGIVAMVRVYPTLLSVAIACAGFAAVQLWRLRAGDSVAVSARPEWMPPRDDDDRAERAERERAERERTARAAEERAVDSVLEKIAREGADRLTDAERAILARATDRRRSGGR
jgi:hypothetical protein